MPGKYKLLRAWNRSPAPVVLHLLRIPVMRMIYHFNASFSQGISTKKRLIPDRRAAFLNLIFIETSYLLRVVFRFNLFDYLLNFPFFIDDNSGAMNAVVFSTHKLLRAPHLVGLHGRFVFIGQ